MKFHELEQAIKELVVKDTHDKLTDKVIHTLAEKELDRRALLTLKAIEAWKVASSNYQKLQRPDVEQFSQDGQPQHFFSKKRREEIGKAKNTVDKLEKLFGDALGEGAKWKELEDFLKNPPKDVPDASGTSAEG